MDSQTALPDKLEPKRLDKGRFKVTSIPCGLFIAYFLLFVILVRLLFSETQSEPYACAGDTVFLQTLRSDSVWPWEAKFNEFFVKASTAGSLHLCDIYTTPSENVKTYPTQKSFKGDTVFQANLSRSTGQIFYLYQLLSLEYEVTAQSGNATTTEGELIVFNDIFYYYQFLYRPNYFYLFVFRQNFSIGANNQPISTLIKFNNSVPLYRKHSYYFVTCATPGNVTFSYNATVVLSEYDRKDFGPKKCSVTRKNVTNQTNLCSFTIPPNTPSLTAFAYVNPNSNPDLKPMTGVEINSHRLLPPPAIFLFVCALFFVTFSVVGYRLCY